MFIVEIRQTGAGGGQRAIRSMDMDTNAPGGTTLNSDAFDGEDGQSQQCQKRVRDGGMSHADAVHREEQLAGAT